MENKRNTAEASPILSTLDASRVQAIAPVNDIPLYDYEGEEFTREVREPVDYAPEEYFSNYKNIGGHSSVSFNFNVGGKESGYNYHL